MRVFADLEYKGKGLSKNKFVDNKKFINCTFEKCNLADYTFTNCEFVDCCFTSCNFSRAFMAQNKNYNSGWFERCLFITCNLKDASFRFPVIDQCEFRNCLLLETNFDGSRFANTKFLGELDSCFFGGYSRFAGSGKLFSFSKFDRLKLPNKMMNVDFSRAKLIGVTFDHNIDLRHCIFPQGPEYVFIADLKTTVKKALEIIGAEFTPGYEKDTAIELVHTLFYNQKMQDQPNLFIDSHVSSELSEGSRVALKLFNLVKSLN